MEFPIGKTLFHLVANTGTSPCPTVDLDLVQTTRKVNGTRHSLRKFQPGKRAHLFRFFTFLGIFQWDEPTKRVPFTTEPEIPEILTKWKAPKASLFVKYLTPTYSYKINEVFANVLWKRFLCEREPHNAITWDFVHRFLIVTILRIRFWAPEQLTIYANTCITKSHLDWSFLFEATKCYTSWDIFFLLAMSKKFVWAFFASKTKLDFSRRITRVAN